MRRYRRIEKFTKYHCRSLREFIEECDRKSAVACTVPTTGSIKVQSDGEKLIANFLYDQGIKFDYDKTIVFDEEGCEVEDVASLPSEDGDGNKFHYVVVRPDFRIWDTDIVIEFWGMLNDQGERGSIGEGYERRMEVKIAEYEELDMKLIGVQRYHLEFLESYLRRELTRLGIRVL